MQIIRTITALLAVPALCLTGLRFSRSFRHADAGWRAAVYATVDTVQANRWAGL